MPAPSNATTDGSMCSDRVPDEAGEDGDQHGAALDQQPRSLMASRSFSVITSATRSGSTSNEPRNMSGSRAMKTAMTITTIGVMWSRKSLNVRPARLAMMMFGRVADEGGCAADVGGDHLGDQKRDRVDRRAVRTPAA